ncbi:hypothetical protein [Taibaiella soli]|uniref:Lipoprotein n=1 Tax=Taibaiella soli TaxID=1649169 RepID=A0A2W2AMT6_9BACT|nr:hypothetical protein [Taibaiella soli]PZF74852.1 hypothetical protein DN068_01250 [Taibaiella soli]
MDRITFKKLQETNRCTIIIAIFFALASCTSRDNNKQYADIDFITCTNLKDSFKVMKSEFRANQALTIAEVSENDKKLLLNRFQYFPVDSMGAKAAGYVFISTRLFSFTDEYMYYLADYEALGRPAQHAYKKDGYYILGISKTKNEIVFCENFPELPPL